MQTLMLLFFLPLMAACFLYLLVIVPVENLRPSLATVRFKRRLFLGLLAIACAGAFAAAMVAPPSAPVASSTAEEIEGAKWSVRCEPLVDAYQACHGPGWSRSVQDKTGAPTHYVVTVERNGPDGSLEVFGAESPVAEVAPAVLEPGAAGVVRFDAGTRTVTFELGSKSIRYELPDA